MDVWANLCMPHCIRTFQQFIENTNTTLFNTLDLSLTTILNKTDEKHLPNVYKTIDESVNLSNVRSTSLQSGFDLRDIIEKAKKLTEYKEYELKFNSNSSNIFYP